MKHSKISNKRNRINKNKYSSKIKQIGGDYYQDSLKEIMNEGQVKNFTLNFVPNKSLNFDVNFDDENLNLFITETAKIIFSGKPFFNKYTIGELNFSEIDIISFLLDDSNINLFDNTDILSLYDKTSSYKLINGYQIVEKNPDDNYTFPIEIYFIFYTLRLLKREILSNNVYINDTQLLNGNTSQQSYSFVCNKYATILLNVKQKCPTATNNELCKLLFLLNASGERVWTFVQTNLINGIGSRIEDIGSIIITAADTFDQNFINYIVRYENAITSLFNMDKSIMSYINNNFQHFIEIVGNKIIVNTVRVYFLVLKLNEPLEGATTKKSNIFLGIIFDKITTNINRNTISDSFKYRWALNSITKDQLKIYNIQNLLPFYYSIPVIHSGYKLAIQNKVGVSMPSFHKMNNVKSLIPTTNYFTKKGGLKGKKNTRKNTRNTRKNKKY